MLKQFLASLLSRHQPPAPAVGEAGLDAAEFERGAADLLAAGDPPGAAAVYLQAIASHPGNPALRVNASNVLKRLGRIAEARAQLETAVALAPELAGAWYNLGLLLHETWFLDEAGQALERALTLAGGRAGTGDFSLLRSSALLLGLTLQKCGRPALARARMEEISTAHPEVARDCLQVGLYSWLIDPEASPDAVLAAHLAWATRFVDSLANTAEAPPVPRAVPGSTHRLRIGYVSGDLRSHAVSLFLEPVLAQHDHSSFEIFLYDNSDFSDATTDRLARQAVRRPTADRDDEVLAQSIRDDRIDILVDLSGHTARNRLGVFARRAAPVQISWLGYRTTTGLQAMDWRITDEEVDPAGVAEAWHRERLLRLPRSQWCFAPPEDPAPGPLPALVRGGLCFGSFNQFERINPSVMAAWARILDTLPDARLLIVGVPLGAARDRFLRTWAGLGVGADRLELHAYVPRERFLSLHDAVDVALDPFPCNGGTTTCESLARGIPVVVLEGNYAVSRAGVSLLRAAGMNDWIAPHVDDYVRIAVESAGTLRRLADLRAALPQRLRNSPLGDAESMTRALEAGFKAAYRDYQIQRVIGPMPASQADAKRLPGST